METPFSIRLSTLALTIGALVSPASARPKKDIIIFKNGDRWTCEIKKLDRAYLYAALDYVDGTVSVDWSKIARVESPQLFVVRDSGGNLFVGPIKTADNPPEEGARALTVGSGLKAHTLDDSTVVSIEQTERGFFEGVHGDINGGLSFSKSNSQSQFTFSSSAAYQRELWSAQAAYNVSFTGSQSSANTLREQLSLVGTRALARKRYFGAALADFQKNDEQQLDLRSAIGAGIGYLLRDTDKWRVYWLAGPVWTREKYSQGASPPAVFSGCEAVVRLGLQFFHFKTTNYQVTLTSYPSITDPGRVRLDGNATVKFQIVRDLYWNFSAYLNYDSRPPRATTKGDYGTTASLGWTF